MKLIIWGKSSYSKLILSLFRSELRSVEGIIFIDNKRKRECTANYTDIISILRDKKISNLCEYHYIIAIGNEYGYERTILSKELEKYKARPIKLWHKTSIIMNDVEIDKSTIIHPGAIVMPYTTIKKNSIINTGASIDHECVIGKGCHIMGNAYLAGRVKVGKYTTIGSNATIFPDIKIGKNCYIGAGSVIRKNVSDNSVYVGNPARYLKKSRKLVN